MTRRTFPQPLAANFARPGLGAVKAFPLLAALLCTCGAAWAQPPAESIQGADLYLNRRFGKVPLEEVSEDILREFNKLPPLPYATQPVPPDVLMEFGKDQAPQLAQQAPAQPVAPNNIYGLAEGEVAIEGGVEMSASMGPGVMFNIIQPGWIEKGDVARIDIRTGPADNHARLYYDVPSDFMSAKWLSFVADYSMTTPAYKLDTAPRYRSSLVGFNWLRPWEHDLIGNWMLYWGVRAESRGVDTRDPSLTTFYRTMGGDRNMYIVPNVGISRVDRQTKHALSEGKTESLHFETSMSGSADNYMKAEYKREQYWELDDRFTFNLYGSLGYARTWKKDGVFPLSQRFLATGRDAVRGYESGTIGPKDPNGNPIGGLRKVVLSGEAYLRGGMLLNEPIYFSAFADGARLDHNGGGIIDNRRNYFGYGVGITWRAPMGMVKFNFARPVDNRRGDRTQTFTFEVKTMLR